MAANTAAAEAEDLVRELEHRNKLLTSRVGVLDSQVERLQREVERRPTAEAAAALREQLSCLSALLGSQLEQEGWSAPDAAAAVAVGVSGENLVQRLQERNGKLSAALSAARQQLLGEQERGLGLEGEVGRLRGEVEEAQALVAQLEVDLSRASGRVGVDVRGSSAVETLLGVEGGGDGGEGGREVLREDLLQVVIGQRDRLKVKLDVVEEEKGKVAEQRDALVQELEGVKADNVAFVGKIRYLQSYQDKQGGTAGGNGGGGGRMMVIQVDEAGVVPEGVGGGGGAGGKGHRYSCGPFSVEVGGGGRHGGHGTKAGGVGGRRRQRLGGGGGCFPSEAVGVDEEVGVEEKYSKAYEARVNPFADFQASEAEARVGSLGLHDKALLAGSKLMVGSKMARAFVAVYAVVLHVFIMVLLYYSATPHMLLEEAAAGAAGGSSGQQQQQAAAAAQALLAQAGGAAGGAAGVGKGGVQQQQQGDAGGGAAVGGAALLLHHQRQLLGHLAAAWLPGRLQWQGDVAW